MPPRVSLIPLEASNGRSGIDRQCAHCDKPFVARADQIKAGAGRFCSVVCGNVSRGKVKRSFSDEERQQIRDMSASGVGWADIAAAMNVTHATMLDFSLQMGLRNQKNSKHANILDDVRRMAAEGAFASQIATAVGVTKGVISGICRRNRIALQHPPGGVMRGRKPKAPRKVVDRAQVWREWFSGLAASQRDRLSAKPHGDGCPVKGGSPLWDCKCGATKKRSMAVPRPKTAKPRYAKPGQGRRLPPAREAFKFSEADIDAFIRDKGVTRLPAAAAWVTTAEISAEDREALARYQAEKEARRLAGTTRYGHDSGWRGRPFRFGG
jgi:hypothetical protein